MILFCFQLCFLWICGCLRGTQEHMSLLFRHCFSFRSTFSNACYWGEPWHPGLTQDVGQLLEKTADFTSSSLAESIELQMASSHLPWKFFIASFKFIFVCRDSGVRAWPIFFLLRYNLSYFWDSPWGTMQSCPSSVSGFRASISVPQMLVSLPWFTVSARTRSWRRSKSRDGKQWAWRSERAFYSVVWSWRKHSSHFLPKMPEVSALGALFPFFIRWQWL